MSPCVVPALSGRTAKLCSSRAAGWPAGSGTTCYFDARDPAAALLERNGTGFLFLLFLPIPLLFMLIGAGGFYIVVFRVQPKPGVRHLPSPTAGRLVIAAVLIVTGSVLFLAFVLHPLRHAIAARSWRTQECKILRSEIRRYTGSKGRDGYSPEIFYSYAVGGHEHRSDTYSFFDYSSGWASARNLTIGYRPGSTVTCYVNPADPD